MKVKLSRVFLANKLCIQNDSIIIFIMRYHDSCCWTHRSRCSIFYLREIFSLFMRCVYAIRVRLLLSHGNSRIAQFTNDGSVSIQRGKKKEIWNEEGSRFITYDEYRLCDYAYGILSNSHENKLASKSHFLGNLHIY